MDSNIFVDILWHSYFAFLSTRADLFFVSYTFVSSTILLFHLEILFLLRHTRDNLFTRGMPANNSISLSSFCVCSWFDEFLWNTYLRHLLPLSFWIKIIFQRIIKASHFYDPQTQSRKRFLSIWLTQNLFVLEWGKGTSFSSFTFKSSTSFSSSSFCFVLLILLYTSCFSSVGIYA